MKKVTRITKRLNLSLSPSLYNDVIYVSGVLGITASALICQTISEAVPHMANMLRGLEATPTPDAARRLRGESIEFIEGRYQDTLAELAKGDDNGY